MWKLTFTNTALKQMNKIDFSEKEKTFHYLETKVVPTERP
ncbi:MAG: type II toxin-antitoxin system RelE family toxin [Janthinobacterium lividum]